MSTLTADRVAVTRDDGATGAAIRRVEAALPTGFYLDITYVGWRWTAMAAPLVLDHRVIECRSRDLVVALGDLAERLEAIV